MIDLKRKNSLELPTSKEPEVPQGPVGNLSDSFSCPSTPQHATCDKGVIVAATKVSHLLTARKSGGYLLFDKDMYFGYPERIMKNGSVLGLSWIPEIYVYIDIKKSLDVGVSFVLGRKSIGGGESQYDLEASCSEGIKGISFHTIRRIVDNRAEYRGALRYIDVTDPDLAYMHKSLIGSKKIWHATYWSKLTRIQEEGLLPNKSNEFGFKAGEHVHLGIGTENLKDFVRRPDVILEIDPNDLSGAIGLIQDNQDTVLIRGGIIPHAFRLVEPIVPSGMPGDLKAEVVNFTEIPIVDFRLPEHDLVNALKHAIEVGFMQVTHHGIPEELFQECLEVGRKFFALPKEKKERLRMTQGESIRGYFGKGAENADGLLNDTQAPKAGIEITRIDCKEGWDMKGCLGDGGGASTKEGATLTAGVPGWPDEDIPEMRRIMTDYQERALEFARRLLLIFGKALELEDPEVFVRSIEQPVATHRLLHYWPLTNLEDEISIGAHCDYGLLTVLYQDDTGGLQVLNSAKEWVHCPPIEGALVCNVGDMLARWTNNRCKSTIHRVVNISASDRYSMPFFLEPRFDTLIDPSVLGIESSEPVQSCEEIVVDFYTRAGLLNK